MARTASASSPSCWRAPRRRTRTARRTTRRSRPGDALLIDFGAKIEGFSADITRTFFCEHVDDRHAEIYETVRAANALGRRMAAPGVTAHELDTAVTDVLRASPFADMIVHKTGHGLGLDVHEAPQVMVGNHRKLEPGFVITIEPGLYGAGDVGVRIEDDVTITEDGARSLTSFPRELRLIGQRRIRPDALAARSPV